MKKLIAIAAGVILAATTQAASVGWSLAGANNYTGDAYQFFVIGQNGTDSIATITALLDAGTDTASYAFGSGSVAANGTAGVAAATSGKSLAAGDYTTFYVIFDAASPASGAANYAVVSGAANLTKTIASTAASVTFMAGSQATFLNNTDNWKSFGAASDVPEPTSALLMLIGMAGLALRRRRA